MRRSPISHDEIISFVGLFHLNHDAWIEVTKDIQANPFRPGCPPTRADYVATAMVIVMQTSRQSVRVCGEDPLVMWSFQRSKAYWGRRIPGLSTEEFNGLFE